MRSFLKLMIVPMELVRADSQYTEEYLLRRHGRRDQRDERVPVGVIVRMPKRPYTVAFGGDRKFGNLLWCEIRFENDFDLNLLYQNDVKP